MNKKSYKVLLLSLYNHEAHGLRQLYSVLKKAGYDTKLVFLKLGNRRNNYLTTIEINLLRKAIVEFGPCLIGCSLVSPNFMLYKKLIEDRVIDCSDAIKLVGGWQATLHPEKTIRYCDIVCIGEGEQAILDLMDTKYKLGYFPSKVDNIWFKRGVDIIKNEVAPLNTNLDSLPVLSFDGKICIIEDNELFNHDPYIFSERYGTILSKGCCHRCSYCSNSAALNIYSNWSEIRFRSVDHIMEELREVKNKFPNIKYINLYDEIFAPTKEWARIFFEKYKNDINLPFYCMFYPGTCDEEMAELLSNAGLQGVWIGIQSGSNRVRKEVFKRHYTNKRLLQQIEVFRKYNISIKYDFIFENPFETEEEFKETIELIRMFPKPYLINMFQLKFFPGTEITQMALKAKLIDKTDDQIYTDYPEYLISNEKQEQIMEMVDGKREIKKI